MSMSPQKGGFQRSTGGNPRDFVTSPSPFKGLLTSLAAVMVPIYTGQEFLSRIFATFQPFWPAKLGESNNLK
jgi:hypothetical protein